MKQKNIYLKLCGGYVLIASVINFLLLLFMSTKAGVGSFNNLLIVALILSYILFKLAINYKLLFEDGDKASLIKLNIVTICLEIPHIFYKGFIYKLTNGIEFVLFAYLNMNQSWNFDTNFTVLRSEFLLKFYDTGNILFGVNLVSILLLLGFLKAKAQTKVQNHSE